MAAQDHLGAQFSQSNAPCADCGTDTLPTGSGRAEHYMVHDSTWQQHGAGRGYLCVGCMEGRMGRQLNSGDFPALPVNDPGISESGPAWSWRTDRMTSRLSSP